MANALITTLGSSGDLNVDVTKYHVFPAVINTSNSSYTTIFSGISWTWAKVIVDQWSYSPSYRTFPGAPAILMPSNTSINITVYYNPYASNCVTQAIVCAVSATSTSLALKSGGSGSNQTINFLIMVPES